MYLEKTCLIFYMSIDAKEHNQFLNNILDFYKTVFTSWVKTSGGHISSALTFSTIRKLFYGEIDLSHLKIFCFIF